MKRYREIRFTVEGSGEFPFDMLRYDRCFPASESDAGKMPRPHQGSSRRIIELIAVDHDGNNRFAPTIGRWESFRWKVIEAKEQASR